MTPLRMTFLFLKTPEHSGLQVGVVGCLILAAENTARMISMPRSAVCLLRSLPAISECHGYEFRAGSGRKSASIRAEKLYVAGFHKQLSAFIRGKAPFAAQSYIEISLVGGCMGNRDVS
jgi:hypothetical protein